MTRGLPAVAAIVLCAVLALPSAAPAQTPKESELKSDIPALTAMHEVIMPMWHDAWPARDHAALAAFLPQIEKHMNAIAKVQLPGILRDKSDAWDAGVNDLRQSVAAYKAAVEDKDNDALMKAAEALHATYEALGKVVRPALQEMDAFHAPLYVLYHYQLNPFDLKGVTSSARTMQEKMAGLNQATLPERLKARQESFVAQRARLSKAVDALIAELAGRDEMRIRAAVEALHIEYEKLEKVF